MQLFFCLTNNEKKLNGIDKNIKEPIEKYC